MSNKILITVGMKCPQPLFEVHKNMKGLAVGQVLEVQADDPAFRMDIEAWCTMTGNELLDISQTGEVTTARVRKAELPG